MPAALMMHDIDPAEKIWKDIGPVEDHVEIFNQQVLVAVYIRPQKTKSGIFLSDTTIDEDRYQGKVGMIVTMGDHAFDDPNGNWFSGVDPKFAEGDWVFFRPSDGWSIKINGVLCRVLEDVSIKGRVTSPDMVF